MAMFLAKALGTPDLEKLAYFVEKTWYSAVTLVVGLVGKYSETLQHLVAATVVGLPVAASFLLVLLLSVAG